MPTLNSAGTIRATLAALERALASTPITKVEFVNVHSGHDDTAAIIREQARDYGWVVQTETRDLSLPAARERLIELAGHEWLLFLDDDVRVRADYLQRLLASVAPEVGAVQGRKESRDEHPSRWVRRRSRRAGTHATLLRREAVANVSIPADVTVLEDEWLRRHVEAQGYLWTFNHQARFDHDCQNRHPIGFHEGYVAGKYGLRPFYELALQVPFAAVTKRNPWPHAMRALGWLGGTIDAATTGGRPEGPAPATSADTPTLADGGDTDT